jgi:hypothetical protein
MNLSERSLSLKNELKQVKNDLLCTINVALKEKD